MAIIGAEATRLAGLQINQLQKYCAGQLTLDELEWWLNLTCEKRSRLMDGEAKPPTHASPRNPRSILAPLYEGEEIVIGETDGKETFAKAQYVFDGYLDQNFERWGTDKPSEKTKAQRVASYKMREDANFTEIFGSFGRDLNALCLTQSQIIQFCVNHRTRLRQDGWSTFFLFKVEQEKGPEYFVAGIRVYEPLLWALVFRFAYSIVWHADDRRRLVFPQL